MTSIDALFSEINRVQDIIAEHDKSPAGDVSVKFMQHSICKAEKAITEGDVSAMTYAYKILKTYTL